MLSQRYFLSLSDSFSAAVESLKTYKFTYIAEVIINGQIAQHRRA